MQENPSCPVGHLNEGSRAASGVHSRKAPNQVHLHVAIYTHLWHSGVAPLVLDHCISIFLISVKVKFKAASFLKWKSVFFYSSNTEREEKFLDVAIWLLQSRKQNTDKGAAIKKIRNRMYKLKHIRRWRFSHQKKKSNIEKRPQNKA